MTFKLRMSGLQHRSLRDHLFPGDGLEAVSLALCGRQVGDRGQILLVHRIVHIPSEHCTERTPVRVTWRTELAHSLIEEACEKDLALMKVHSHPGGFDQFSVWDDRADQELFQSIFGWADSDLCHGSAVMLPGGRMFGRVALPGVEFRPLDRVAVAGDDLHFWDSPRPDPGVVESQGMLRNRQIFGEGTMCRLKGLSIAVIGYSGTGSIVVEQLARLGVGRLVIIDFDRSEEKNLNRILNSGLDDVRANRLKVDVAARAIQAMGLGTSVEVKAQNVIDVQMVRLVAECDVVFGCTDSVEARHFLNRLAAYYSLPYFDVGVRLVADGIGGIDQVCGSAHYMQPGGASLLSRGLYIMDDVRAEAMRRTDKVAYEGLVKESYISGVQVDRPAVISVNMLIASLSVNDFIARIHPFRLDENRDFAVQTVSLTQGEFLRFPEGEPCSVMSGRTGLGDRIPLLDMPTLSEVGQ